MAQNKRVAGILRDTARLPAGYLSKMEILTNQQNEVNMTKEVQMSIKMEAELRDQFMAVAAAM